MKTTKISIKTKVLSTFLCVVVLASCDVLEHDEDVVKPAIGLRETEIYVRANTSGFIDLNKAIQANQPVKLAVTSSTRFGKLTDHGQGLLEYSPSVGTARVGDSFEFTVYSEDNDVLDRDTVVIIVEDDTTDLPCGIYPADDYIYNAQVGTPVVINVLDNDYMCGYFTTDVIVSVYKPGNSFPPNHGTTTVQGQSIVYTPGNSFNGSDNIIYKLTPKNKPNESVYGMVHLSGNQVCNFTLANDQFIWIADGASLSVELPVLDNDTLCAIPIPFGYYINIIQPPQHGEAHFHNEVDQNELIYSLSSQPDQSFTDFFYYEVCIDGVCKTARVDISVEVNPCVLLAVNDVFDTTDSIETRLNVLLNDTICDGNMLMTITSPPVYGTASKMNDNTIMYYPDTTSHHASDSLRYRICNNNGCSEASVLINFN